MTLESKRFVKLLTFVGLPSQFMDFSSQIDLLGLPKKKEKTREAFEVESPTFEKNLKMGLKMNSLLQISVPKLKKYK